MTIHTKRSFHRGLVLGLLSFLAFAGTAGASEGKLDAHYRLDAGWRGALNAVKRQLDAAPPGTKFVYLSGPISSGGLGSVEANLAAGNAAAKALRRAGFYVVSPFELESKGLTNDGPTKHASFMRVWTEVLADPRVTQIVLMPGAESSLGATQEIGLFQTRGGKISQFVAQPHGFKLAPYAYDPVMGRLEHTLLGMDATDEDVAREARWAGTHGARAMVVRPQHTATVAKAMIGGKTIATSVIGFPKAKFSSPETYAHVPTSEKIDDAKLAIDGFARGGAKVGELDMILDVHALRAGRYADVEQDIESVIATATRYGKARGVKIHVKVIVETSLLSPNEVKMAAGIVRNTNALAIKTSTGYGSRGASLGDLAIMNRVIAGTKLVKASGGISPANFARFSRRADIFGMSRTREMGQPPAPRRGGAKSGY